VVVRLLAKEKVAGPNPVSRLAVEFIAETSQFKAGFFIFDAHCENKSRLLSKSGTLGKMITTMLIRNKLSDCRRKCIWSLPRAKTPTCHWHVCALIIQH
jgi:hypothetical protein